MILEKWKSFNLDGLEFLIRKWGREDNYILFVNYGNNEFPIFTFNAKDIDTAVEIGKKHILKIKDVAQKHKEVIFINKNNITEEGIINYKLYTGEALLLFHYNKNIKEVKDVLEVGYEVVWKRKDNIIVCEIQPDKSIPLVINQIELIEE